MKQYGTKFRLIFLPFALITIVSVCIYTSLHWYLFIKNNFFTLDEEVLNFFVPFSLPWIPILIWLRPRIKLLNLKNKNGKGDPLMGFMMVAWIAMAAPNIIAQEYIVTSTGKLTTLNVISQIDSLPKTKYYKPKHLYIDKSLARFYTRFAVSGKYNTDFDMYIYAAVPIFDTIHLSKTYRYKISSPKSSINSDSALIILNGKLIPNDSLNHINPRSIKNITVLKGGPARSIYGDKAKNGVILIKTNHGQFRDTLQSIWNANKHFTPSAWVGIKYEKTIRNRLSTAEKNERYQQFAKASTEDFNAKSLDQFGYLDRINYSSDLKGYTSAIKSDKYTIFASPIIVLVPVNGAFEARNGSKLQWIFGSFGIGSVIFMLILLIKPLKEDENVVTEETKEEGSTVRELKTFFIPRQGFYITPIIIDLNIFIFIVMACAGMGLISFNALDLLKWGGNYRPAIDNKEYWRLVTNMFLHGGLMHILFNMYGLLFVGILLEPILGSGKFLFAYFFTGIMASIASIWWHPATVSVGASGAIFGMYGVFFALLTLNLFPPKVRKPFLINVSIFIGYNLIFGLTGGIDNAAHIGGLLSGLIIGYILYPLLKNKSSDAENHQQIIDELSGKSDKQTTE